mgnify:CR=1 FL=1
MVKFKLDLHTHTSDFVHLIFTKPSNVNYLVSLLDLLFKKHGNLILGIANFNDDCRYEKIMQVSKRLHRGYNTNYKFKECFFSISKNGKTIYFVKADEIDTNKGHILIIGHEGKIRKRNLKEILKEAHKDHSIIIASHPLHNVVIGHFIIKKMSLSSEDIAQNKRQIDAIELDSYFPKDWRKIKKISKTQKIPVVSESDAHFLGEFFKSYFELDNLSFRDSNRFRKTLKKALRRKIKLHAQEHNFMAEYKHIFQVYLSILGKKLHILEY